MNRCHKLAHVVITAILSFSAVSCVHSTNTKFMVEFGEYNNVESKEAKSRREQFCQLLTEHAISYKIEADSLGRIWVIPDQNKRIEFEQVNKLWEKNRAESIKAANEKNGL